MRQANHVSRVAASKPFLAHSGSPIATTQIVFHASSTKSSGSILIGYRTPSTASSVIAPSMLRTTPRMCSTPSGERKTAGQI